MPMRKLKNYKPTRFMAETSHYSKQMADFAVMFIEQLTHTKGTWAGKPFELIDWQERIIRDLFGVLKPNGYRQFNTAYIEIPKKMGKSELAAAVALLLCCGDGEERAEVYGCAADRQQATIVFDVAADMVRMCPALNRRVKILTSQKRIIYEPTNSFYQVLSAEAYSKHGFNIHGVVFDELHTQPNRKLFDVMTKGSGDARMQPLYFLITTAGNDTNTICYEVHQKAQDILDGRKVDPTFYPVIYGAEPDEDWTDPEVWKKANPSLGITVGIDKVEAACESAKQNPGEENSFRQLRLNQWVKQAVRWMPMDKWDACAFPVNEDDLEGRVCYGGLDLSSTTDITSFVLVFPPRDEDDKYVILPYFWVPEDTLELRVRRDHVPYDSWEKEGMLQTTEGNVIHYGYIEKFIERLGERFNIREIAFDRWGAVQMVQNLENMGFTVVPFGQGFKDMSPPTKELMKLTLEQKLAHGGHPVLRWNMDNIFIRTDPAGNIKADKEKSTEKIIRNGKGEVVALYPLMPNRMTVNRDENGELYYEYQTAQDEAHTMNGSRVRLQPSDVLHVPGLGFDGLVGYSPIAMAKNAIGMAIACEEYGAKFFANGATPGGILEHPGVVKDPERVRESWSSAFGGSSNANKVAVLEEGMKYTPISISPEQAQFLETRKFQINEIARIFRIPPHMIGDLEKSSFSNIEQQSLEFVKYTLDPWVCRWEQSMQRALLSLDEKKEYFFKFNVDGLLRGDYQSRMNGYAVGRQNGWMSANDIRELENLDRIPEEEGGDLYLINGNMTKLKDAGIFAVSAQTQEEADETKETQTEPEPEDGRTRFRKKEAL